MKQLTLFFITLLIFINANAIAIDLPTSHAVPGGFVVLPIGKISATKNPPKVFFASHRAVVVQQQNQWWTIVGIPIAAKPGQASITIDTDQSKTQKNFTIHSKKYPVQHIYFKEKNYVSPDKPTVQRIFDDNEHMRNALAEWTDATPHSFHLKWPIEAEVCPLQTGCQLKTQIDPSSLEFPLGAREASKRSVQTVHEHCEQACNNAGKQKAKGISSVYGLQRILNGELKSPHQGIDIAAPTGTKVIAAADGEVANIGDYFLTGNTIILDHGQSFKTIYCHLSKVNVQLHQIVKKGQLIGLVGSTGRATGPHLHFGVSLNNVRVNPIFWLVNQDKPVQVQDS